MNTTETRGGAVANGGHIFSALIVNGAPVAGAFCPGEDVAYALSTVAALTMSGDDNSWPGVESVEIFEFTFAPDVLRSPVFTMVFPRNAVPTNASTCHRLPKEKFKEFAESIKKTLFATREELLEMLKSPEGAEKADKEIKSKVGDLSGFFVQKKGNA